MQKKTPTIPFKMPSKIPKNKLNQDIKTLNLDKINGRKFEEFKRYPMILDQNT